jgi:endogenous inhibitor of DNA gyrase (YacG/DUF329 family)
MLPSATVHCPYCGEPVELLLDDSVEQQRYVEDCAVCCRPIDVTVVVEEGTPAVRVAAEDE